MLCWHATLPLQLSSQLINIVSYQKELSTDLDDLMTLLQQAEKDLQQYNTKQIKERLPLVEVNFHC